MNKDLALTVIRNIPGVLGDWYLANEGTILPWVSIVSSGAAIGFAVKDSRFILDTIDDGREILSTEQNPETRKAIYKSVLRDIAPKIGRIAACYAVAITATLVNKNHRDKEIAKLTASLGLMTNAVAQYQLWEKEAKKALEPEKIQEINNAVATKQVEAAPPTDENTKGTEPSKYLPGEFPQGWFLWKNGNVNRDEYFLSHHGPNDIRQWVINTNAELDRGSWWEENNTVTFNDFLEFLGEGIDEDYTNKAYDNNPKYCWKKQDDEFNHHTDTIDIDLGYGGGSDGRPVNVFHCNFCPF